MRKSFKRSLQNDLVVYRGKTLKHLTPDYRETLWQEYQELAHSEWADREMIELCLQMMDRLCPEKAITYQPDDPGEPEAQSQDRREQHIQEYHHPKRPPSALTAPLPPVQPPPSPFVDCFLCLFCEKYFWGQIVLRTATCMLCGKGNLRPVSTWDLRTQPKPPFNSQGGAA